MALALFVLGALIQAGLLTYLYSVRGVIKERQKRVRMSEAAQLTTANTLQVENEPEEVRTLRKKLELEAEEKREKDERRNRVTLTPMATKTAKWISLPNAVLLGFVIVGLLLGKSGESFLFDLIDFVTSNLGAGLVCSVLVATFGWLIVQFWQITDAKNKTRDYKIDLDKAERARSADAKGRLKAMILGWRVERPLVTAGKWLSARSRREEKVDRIKRAVLEMSSTVDDEVFLEQTVRDMRNERYAEIARRLITKNRINPQTAPTMIALLEATGSQLLTSHRERLENFDLETLER